MIHVILCMPQPFVDALMSSSDPQYQLDSLPLPTVVSYTTDVEDREIYAQLQDIVNQYDKELDGILVIGEHFGSRGSTLSLSVTHANLNLVTGANLAMISPLRRLYHEVNQLDLQPSDGLSWIAERLIQAGRDGICASQDYMRDLGEESLIDASILEELA